MVEQPRRVSTVSKLCEHAEIPEHFTRKMLQPLVRAGILRSARGPGGGFTFGREPAEVSLMDVVCAIESSPRFDLCILGSSTCDSENPCPLHDQWEPIKEAVREMLRDRSIADLAMEENGPGHARSNDSGNGASAGLEVALEGPRKESLEPKPAG